jgi:hypothetical protein
LKAYLIRERGVDGSAVNEYAPFYLWNGIGAMAKFLVGGGGFQNIVRDFGRPAVQQWTGIAWQAGQAVSPRAASRRLSAIPADGDPSGLGLSRLIEREITDLRTLAERDDVYGAALAVDPSHWRLLRFVLWKQDVPAEETATERYEVLHLSTPGLTELPAGQGWSSR